MSGRNSCSTLLWLLHFPLTAPLLLHSHSAHTLPCLMTPSYRSIPTPLIFPPTPLRSFPLHSHAVVLASLCVIFCCKILCKQTVEQPLYFSDNINYSWYGDVPFHLKLRAKVFYILQRMLTLTDFHSKFHRLHVWSYNDFIQAWMSTVKCKKTMCTGYVPSTQLYRNTSRVKRVFNVVCFHFLLRCFRLTRTVKQAALQVVNLATSETYEGSCLAIRGAWLWSAMNKQLTVSFTSTHAPMSATDSWLKKSTRSIFSKYLKIIVRYS